MERNPLFRALMLALVVALGGCAYGGVATVKDSHVVIARNDAFLCGALRQVFVCKVTAAGVTGCAAKDNP
jgi:hypothetical protein